MIVRSIHGIFAILNGPGVGENVVLGPFESLGDVRDDPLVKEAEHVRIVGGKLIVQMEIGSYTNKR